MDEHQFDHGEDGQRPVLPPLTGAQAALVSSFARLVATDPAEATDGELGEAAVDLVTVEAALDGVGHRWLTRLEASMVWALDGARNAATWLSTNGEISRTRSAGRMRTARTVGAHPAWATATAEGRIGPEKTRLLREAHRRVPGSFAEQHGWLVDTVEGLTVSAAQVFLEQWRERAMAEEGIDDGDPGRDGRHLHLSTTFQGRMVAKGELAPEIAALVGGAVASEIDAWFRAGHLDDDGRTRAQLQADALGEICRRHGRPATTAGRPRPQLIAHVDLDDLARRAHARADATRRGTDGDGAGPGHSGGGHAPPHPGPAPSEEPDSTRSPDPDLAPPPAAEHDVGPIDGSRPAGDRPSGDGPRTGPFRGPSPPPGPPVTEPPRAQGPPRRSPDPPPGRPPDRPPQQRAGPDDHPRPRCEIEGHGPVAPETIERLLCEADICRVVTRGRSEVLDVGMTHRLATAAQRTAVRVRAGGRCEIGECPVPFDHCQIHHLTPFDPVGGTGPTDLANLAAACSHHHHLLHEGRHTARHRPDGRFDLVRPDGTVVATTRTHTTPPPVRPERPEDGDQGDRGGPGDPGDPGQPT